jgi:hypothetical protein
MAARPARANLSADWWRRTRASVSSLKLEDATDQSESSIASSWGRSSRPQALTASFTLWKEGSVPPRSSRAIADWVVPKRSASSCWERPARRLASLTRSPAFMMLMIADTLYI